MLKNNFSKFENRIHRLRNRRFGGDVRHGRQVVGEEPMRASRHGLPNSNAISKRPTAVGTSPSSLFMFFMQGFFLQGLALYGSMLDPVRLLDVNDVSANEELSQPSRPRDAKRRVLSLAAAASWICERWRREREIRRAIDALAKLDDRTLRDIGIPDRSQIDPVVRYCRDC
jgi:uncharacterized protein YjiS (DUF1127 family)